MVKVRIHIREQLCILILITNLVALGVLAVSTWFQTVHYLNGDKLDNLRLTANLKAEQVAQDIALLSTSVQSIATREELQSLLGEYNNGNDSSSLVTDLEVGNSLSIAATN
jgi:osomolarity two-component system, sensor histidine kinase SLN1